MPKAGKQPATKPTRDVWRHENRHGDVEVVNGVRYVFDSHRADRVCNFFAWFLTHHEGRWSGRPFVLQGWQRLVMRRAFGWVNAATRKRRYRTVFIFVPRKNGKSTMAAGCGLYLTCADHEAAAQVYSAAADREQAAIVFDIAKAMVEQSQDLRSMIQPFKRTLAMPTSRSRYTVLSSDANSKHGFNAHGVLIDELHAHPSRDLYDVLVTSMLAREQPMVLVTTTAGVDRHSICFEQYSYARKVNEGVIQDPTFLPVLFEPDDGDDWNSPEVWAKCNPNLGVTISREAFEAEYRKAKAIPGFENTFKRLYLNIWTEQESRWLPMDLWRDCAGPDRDVAFWNGLRGRDCYVGIDLSSTRDLTAMVGVFPDAKRETVDVIARFWVPKQSILERANRDKVPYPQWSREGWITETEGGATDQTAIKAALDQWARLYNVKEVAVDRWEATRLLGELEADGYTAFAHGQGYASMSAPSKQLERMLLAKQIRHGGNPVLAWNVSNAAIDTDPAGNIKPTKAGSTERIDGLVAMIMALGRATLLPERTRSVYDSRGDGLKVLE